MCVFIFYVVPQKPQKYTRVPSIHRIRNIIQGVWNRKSYGKRLGVRLRVFLFYNINCFGGSYCYVLNSDKKKTISFTEFVDIFFENPLTLIWRKPPRSRCKLSQPLIRLDDLKSIGHNLVVPLNADHRNNRSINKRGDKYARKWRPYWKRTTAAANPPRSKPNVGQLLKNPHD